MCTNTAAIPDIVTIDETGSNTGVFESQSGDDSEISVKMTPVMATPSP